MPRHVDHEQRRRAIVEATMRVLAAHGPSGLTFRAVAKEMGGSSTPVTHSFPTREALLDTLLEQMAEWPQELREIEGDARDPHERLRRFLRWMLPADDRGRMEERARLSLLGELSARDRAQHLFDSWDANVRRLFAEHLEGLVAPERLQATVDVLRTLTNGLTLTWGEHPEEWPAERQFAVLDAALAAFDLLPTDPTHPPIGGVPTPRTTA